jgi:hypothetical protein
MTAQQMSDGTHRAGLHPTAFRRFAARRPALTQLTVGSVDAMTYVVGDIRPPDWSCTREMRGRS